MLDLDHTSLFGNDGNDMGIVLQHMNKSYSTMQLLYDKLINPNLRTMFEAYKAQGKEIQVVVTPGAPRSSVSMRHIGMPTGRSTSPHR